MVGLGHILDFPSGDSVKKPLYVMSELYVSKLYFESLRGREGRQSEASGRRPSCCRTQPDIQTKKQLMCRSFHCAKDCGTEKHPGICIGT